MKSLTIVIIGGGVIGLSSAYHLARRKAGRVVLLEKGPVGDGASSRAAGIINGLLWTEPGVLARHIALQRYRELSEELDGYRFQDIGCLNLFDESVWPNQAAVLPLYDRLDAPYEVLDANQIHRRWPALTPGKNLTGLFDPRGGYSEPEHYVPALATGARRLGVEIRENQPVTGFLDSGGRITGVTTDHGDVEADAIVCAAHVWSMHLLGQRLDCHLPAKPFLHQRFVSEPTPAKVQIPAVNANTLGGYVRPAHGSRLLVGLETPEHKQHPAPTSRFRMTELAVDPDYPERARKNLLPLVPALKDLPWHSEHIGLLCFSMDGEPILGPVASHPGLYIATAFHSGGFAYNPAVGSLLADMIVDGESPIDISAFSPDRFDRQQSSNYLCRDLTQGEVVDQVFFPRRH